MSGRAYLFHAAALMRERKHEFSALMTLEVGKSWTEADADTAEAIDFMEFYGREMLRLGPGQPTAPYPHHETQLYYIPLGVGVVIPPWNFPCAIMAGMTTATIVSRQHGGAQTGQRIAGDRGMAGRSVQP